MKLKKLPLNEASLHPDASSLRPSPQQEAEWLRHKHFGLSLDDGSFGQKPFGGFGGSGRKMPKMEDVDDTEYWIQMIEKREDNGERILKGGHGVPLSGEYPS